MLKTVFAFIGVVVSIMALAGATIPGAHFRLYFGPDFFGCAQSELNYWNEHGSKP